MKKILYFFVFNFTLIFASTTIAQHTIDSLVKREVLVKENPRDKVKYRLSLEQDGCEAYVVANIQIIEGWHINGANLPMDCYSLPTEITLTQYTLLSANTNYISEAKYDNI